MATQILRRLDRWHFEGPMALLLAAAAGFAAMAMPHDLFAQLPVAGGYGRPGQGGLALGLALVCGIAGYVAMRRPTQRVPAEPEDEFEGALEPMVVAVGQPVRLRRADRHPDAPAREPIRASRDLGEPFMDVAPSIGATSGPATAPAAPEQDAQPAEQPVAQHDEPPLADEAPVEVAPIEAEPLAIEAEPVEPVVPTAIATLPAEPVATGAAPILLAAPEPVAMPEPLSSIAKPAVVTPARFAFAGIGRREDTSLAGMIDRLSEGMKLRSEAGARPLDPPRDRGPALRAALDELNRLAVRRG